MRYFTESVPEIPNFDPYEFRCRCGCGIYKVSYDFVKRLQEARWESGIPFIINSGARCARHDGVVSISKNKTHRKRHAADISTDPDKLARLGVHMTVLEIMGAVMHGLIMARFKRIGISFKGLFIHADDYLWTEAQRPIIWGYK
jgi:hypothetical protein